MTMLPVRIGIRVGNHGIKIRRVLLIGRMKDASDAVLGNSLRAELLVPVGSSWVVESARRSDGNHSMV